MPSQLTSWWHQWPLFSRSRPLISRKTTISASGRVIRCHPITLFNVCLDTTTPTLLFTLLLFVGLLLCLWFDDITAQSPAQLGTPGWMCANEPAPSKWRHPPVHKTCVLCTHSCSSLCTALRKRNYRRPFAVTCEFLKYVWIVLNAERWCQGESVWRERIKSDTGKNVRLVQKQSETPSQPTKTVWSREHW